MIRNSKEHSRRLERLIKFVNKEQNAGRLTEQQVEDIAKASLKPLKEKENSLAYFMLGGGLAEDVAQKCCVLLIDQLMKHLPNDSHVLRMIDSMKPPSRAQREQ